MIACSLTWVNLWHSYHLMKAITAMQSMRLRLQCRCLVKQEAFQSRSTTSAWWACNQAEILRWSWGCSRPLVFHTKPQMWTTGSTNWPETNCLAWGKTCLTKSMSTCRVVDSTKRVPCIQGDTLMTLSWSSTCNHSNRRTKPRFWRLPWLKIEWEN